MKRIITAIAAIVFMLLGAAAAEAVLPTVNITGDSLTNWTGKEDVREATLEYCGASGEVSFIQAITIKIQGTSSLWYEKKNYTIELQEFPVEMQPGWGEQTGYCLKADYIDPTHAGNVVSAKLAAQMQEATGKYEWLPNRGAIDGFPVWLTLNGEDMGIYSWNIPKGGWMFNMDENDPDHIVMCCEGWSEGCVLQSDTFLLDDDWSIEFGPESSKTVVKFDRLVDFIVNSSDEKFVRDFDKYLDLDACLNYYCFICIANANDNEAKNMLMVTWDGEIWQPMLYDLDSLWGVDGGGSALTTDIALSLANGGSNRLFQRIWENYSAELTERYAYLRSSVLSNDNIWKTFDEYAALIPAEALEWDNARWNPDGYYIRTYELMREQMAIYLPYIDAEFGYVPE